MVSKITPFGDIWNECYKFTQGKKVTGTREVSIFQSLSLNVEFYCDNNVSVTNTVELKI